MFFYLSNDRYFFMENDRIFCLSWIAILNNKIQKRKKFKNSVCNLAFKILRHLDDSHIPRRKASAGIAAPSRLTSQYGSHKISAQSSMICIKFKMVIHFYPNPTYSLSLNVHFPGNCPTFPSFK